MQGYIDGRVWQLPVIMVINGLHFPFLFQRKVQKQLFEILKEI